MTKTILALAVLVAAGILAGCEKQPETPAGKSYVPEKIKPAAGAAGGAPAPNTQKTETAE